MYVKTLGDFYTTTADKIYRGQINFKIMSTKELDNLIKDGLVTFNKLHPHKDRGVFEAFSIVALCVVAVAAVATAMAGAPAASGAVSATTGASTATGTAVATGAAPATGIGSQIMTGVKETAAYITSKVKSEFKSAAESVPDRLEETGKKLVDDKVTDAAMEAFGFELDVRGQTIENPESIAALRERLKREQENYSTYLLKQSNDLRNAQNLPAKESTNFTSWLVTLAPIAFLLFR